MSNNQQKKYVRDQILNASPGELIVLLYDGAIRCLEKSKQEVNKEDQYEFSYNITKAESIIGELMGALKKEVFPELVENLAKLYDFMYRQLVSAHKEKDVERVDQVITLLKGLKGSWVEALENAVEEEHVEQTEGEQQTQATQKAETPEQPKPKAKPALSFQA
jgi:flagellar secretion chaperone FliS